MKSDKLSESGFRFSIGIREIWVAIYLRVAVLARKSLGAYLVYKKTVQGYAVYMGKNVGMLNYVCDPYWI